MEKRKRSNKLLKADYPEDIVGFAIESFLTIISLPGRDFSIIPLTKHEERLKGYDAELISTMQAFKPFYMQFKRPYAYPSDSTSNIIRDRRKKNYTIDPRVLFFELRDKKPHHDDYQHNILRKILNEGKKAAYVCPLFLDREAYRSYIHQAAQTERSKFVSELPLNLSIQELKSLHSRGLRFSSGNSGSANTRNWSDNPTFPGSIIIPPCEKIDCHGHRYSFTEGGEEILFHSPTAVKNGINGFDKWIYSIYKDFKANRGLIWSDTAKNESDSLIQALKINTKKWDFSSQEGVKSWLHLGAYLKNEYDIDQFAFVQWKNT